MSFAVPVKVLPNQNTQNLAAVLHTQGQVGGNAIACQNFEGAFAGYRTLCADDFDIPAGDTWGIQRVEANGLFWNGGFMVNSTDLFFCSGAVPPANLAGCECSYSGLANNNGQFSALLDLSLPSTCTLTTGHYWMILYVNMGFGGNGQWGWSESSGFYTESHWTNPNGSFGICPTWQPRVSVCGVGSNPDHAYTLHDDGGGDGDGDGDGDGSGGCDLAPIEAKLDAAEVKLDNVQCNVDLTPIEAKLDAAEVKLDDLGQGGTGGCDCCSIVDVLLPLLPGSPELPTTHQCYNP
jgi:hypothetical protein